MKIKGPLLSENAHGSIAKAITYSKRRTHNHARKYQPPRKDPSPKQRAQRRITEFLVAQWQNMAANDKASWNTEARNSGLNITGYQYFLRTAQRNLYTHHGLLAYWSMNEIVDGKILDLSGRNNHGTLQPDYPTDAPIIKPSGIPRFSNSMSFNGTSNYIDCGDFANVFSTQEVTVLFWEKFTETPPATNRYPYSFGVGKQRAYHDSGSNLLLFVFQFVNSGQVYASNYWYPKLNQFGCAAATFDGRYIKLYRNGELTNTKDLGEQDTLVDYTGDHLWLCRQSTTYLKVVFDEMCIYNRALSAEEIKTRYNFARAKV